MIENVMAPVGSIQDPVGVTGAKLGRAGLMGTASRKVEWLRSIRAVKDRRKRARRTICAWLAAGMAPPIGFAAFPASAGIFGDKPDAIVCPLVAIADHPGGLVVYYINGLADDGTAYYKSLSRGAKTVTVSQNGTVSARKIKDCDGKTVKELREAGRAFDLR